MLEVHVPERVWRFKSSRPHQLRFKISIIPVDRTFTRSNSVLGYGGLRRNDASIAGSARTFSFFSQSDSTLAPAATKSATTSRWRPWFPAGGSDQPWTAQPSGGELYFSSLRLTSEPGISFSARRA